MTTRQRRPNSCEAAKITDGTNVTPAMIAAGVKVLGDEGYAVVSEYVARELAQAVFREMMTARDKSSDDSLGLEKTS